MGRESARLFTEPLRPLTAQTSKGYEVARFADEVLGEPLLPWQRWLAIHALELNPDGSFRFRVVLVLVARQNGKTSLLRTVALWRLYVDGARLVLGVAQDLGMARETWREAVDMAKSVPALADEVDKVAGMTGDEHLRLTSGARYKIGATNRSAGRGLSVDHLSFDEIREQRDWAPWSAVSKTTSARPHGQIWAVSNAGDDESVVLNHLREAGLSGSDPSIGLFEWSAPEGCDLDDRDGWAQANPGLGYTVSERAIASSLGTDPPAVFRTEVLCQRVEALDNAIDGAGWRACHDPAGTMDGVRDRVVACVDVAPDGDHVSVVAAADLPDGRVRVEPVAAWSSTEQARDELESVLTRVRPRAVAWFPSGPAAALAPILRRTDGNVELSGTRVSEACQGLADLVRARRVLHPGDPLLDAHVASAAKHAQGDGWRFARRGGGHVDCVYAAAGAVYAALTEEIEAPMPKPMVV